MALDLNGSGQGMYRSLSQGANPFQQSPEQQALASTLGTGQGGLPRDLDPTAGAGVGVPTGPVTGDGGAAGSGGLVSNSGSNPTVPPHPAYNTIQNAYQQWLGRTPDPQEVMSHLAQGPGGPGGFGQVQYALGNIMNSPEAKLYSQTQKGLQARQKQAAAGAGQTIDPGGGGPMTGTGAVNPGFAAGPGQGGAPADPGVTGQGAGVAAPPVGPSVNPPAPQQAALNNAVAPAGAMPQGIDPALAAIYQGSGLTPADRGTGFADWQYWQGVGPSQYDRLKADIAGTGTDQPTGTPGTGAWQQSGQGAGAAVPAAGGMGTPVSAPQVSPLVNYAQQIPGIAGQPVDYTQGIMQALLKQLGLQGALS